MAFKNDGKQFAEYVYDFAKDGGAVGNITLSGLVGQPAMEVGAIVTGVYMKVLTTCTSGGSATVSIGPGADVDGYIESQAVADLTAGALFGGEVNGGALLWDDTEDAAKQYLVTSTANTQSIVLAVGTAALTAGKIGIVVEYLLPAFGHR